MGAGDPKQAGILVSCSLTGSEQCCLTGFPAAMEMSSVLPVATVHRFLLSSWILNFILF